MTLKLILQGNRVKLNDAGKACKSSVTHHWHGTVIGESKYGYYIKWDQQPNRETWTEKREHLERIG